jgi:hypothetical protein
MGNLSCRSGPGKIDFKKSLGLGSIYNSPFITMILSNLELWLKGDTGIILNGSSRVTTWQDQSGNNRHFVDRSTIGIGGSYVLPTVVGNTLKFTASSTYSSPTATVLACASSSLNLTTPYTIFVVARGRNGAIISKSTEDSKRRKTQISMDDAGVVYSLESYGGSDTGITYTTGTGLNLNTKRLIAARYNSNTSRELRYNGVLVNTSSAEAGLQYTNSAPVYIGASPFQYNSSPSYNAEACLETYIYEIILYGRALTDFEVSKVESYLNLKYTIY